jgi:hypothetical protein
MKRSSSTFNQKIFSTVKFCIAGQIIEGLEQMSQKMGQPFTAGVVHGRDAGEKGIHQVARLSAEQVVKTAETAFW